MPRNNFEEFFENMKSEIWFERPSSLRVMQLVGKCIRLASSRADLMRVVFVIDRERLTHLRGRLWGRFGKLILKRYHELS